MSSEQSQSNTDWFGDKIEAPSEMGEPHTPWENWYPFCQGEGCMNASELYYIEESRFLCFDCADIVIT